MKRLALVLALLFPIIASAQYVSSGLIYPDGIEPGDPSVCEAPGGKTCYWVDCDASSDGTGTYASPFWGFETVFGYYDSGASYVLGSARGGDYIYVKGSCLPSVSSDTATGPYQLVRIGRAAQMGTAAEPVVIKSWRGESQAVFDGEYRTTLGTQIRTENSPNAGLIRVEQSAAANSYIKIQNIKIYRYHTTGIRVEPNTEGVTIQSVTCQDGRVDQNAGTGGCFSRNYNASLVFSDDFSYNYFVDNNHTCNTYVGDADANCPTSTNDGTVTLTTEPAASTGSVANIHHNLDENSTKFLHEKHNGNVTVNVYQNYISAPDIAFHLRAKQTNIYDNVIVTPTSYVFELDPENETLNVSLSAYNNSIYMTSGKLMYSLDNWNDDGTIEVYDNAIKSTSTSTPFFSLAPYAGQYFVRASFTMDHNYFDVPSVVQTSFSCFGPTSAGASCTTRNFADTKTELGDSTSSVTDPLFTDPGSEDFNLQVGASSRTAGRSGGYLGAIDPGSPVSTPTPTPTPTPEPVVITSGLTSIFRKGQK